ncbi:MAG: GNAT family N-acetyltransferase, partial [Verrucomicrobiota bacterium]
VKISKVYLLESVQRRGLGRAILEFIGGEAVAVGATALWLQVNKRNTVAMGAYRKAGFAVTGEGIFLIGGGYVMDDYLMSKEIGEIAG